MKRLLFAFTLLVLICQSCSKETETDPFDPSQNKILKNEAYGTASLQKADVYLPANRSSNTPIVILVHGGFWNSGDKADMDTLLPAIKAADPSLVIVNINYRLADADAANRHPAQMEDMETLFDYLDSHASTWHTGNKYALVGVSSGAHLSLLYSYAFDAKKRVKLVGSVIGPTNFSDTYYINQPLFQSLAAGYLGKTWLQDSVLHKAVSPALQIKAGAPPTFMAYGGADLFVPVSNATLLQSKLNSLGIASNYTVYAGEGHDLSSTAIIDIIAKLIAYIKATI